MTEGDAVFLSINYVLFKRFHNNIVIDSRIRGNDRNKRDCFAEPRNDKRRNCNNEMSTRRSEEMYPLWYFDEEQRSDRSLVQFLNFEPPLNDIFATILFYRSLSKITFKNLVPHGLLLMI